VPRKFREGVAEALIELEGERWLVGLDKHGRVYIPVKLRPSIEKAKTIIIKREGSTIILKPRPY
jgi:DNA-binding transcriptional regulator/RsmH inhibitor MraZ